MRYTALMQVKGLDLSIPTRMFVTCQALLRVCWLPDLILMKLLLSAGQLVNSHRVHRPYRGPRPGPYVPKYNFILFSCKIDLLVNAWNLHTKTSMLEPLHRGQGNAISDKPWETCCNNKLTKASLCNPLRAKKSLYWWAQLDTLWSNNLFSYFEYMWLYLIIPGACVDRCILQEKRIKL